MKEYILKLKGKSKLKVTDGCISFLINGKTYEMKHFASSEKCSRDGKKINYCFKKMGHLKENELSSIDIVYNKGDESNENHSQKL